MMLLRTLWNDEAGFIISAELVLVATILVIGLVVGLVVVRNQVVQELVDVGQAIGSLNQSYSFAGTAGGANICIKPWWTGGSHYDDVIDFCQSKHDQHPGTPPGGIILTFCHNMGEDP